MTWIKYAIITLLFFFFALLQTGFLPYFNIAGNIPNLIFILFFILIFFEAPFKSEGFFIAIIAGFFSDMFFPSFFGFSIVSFLIIYYINKVAAHFLKESQEKYQVFYFMPIFSACFVIYNALLYMFSIFFAFNYKFNSSVLVSLLYSLVLACVGFYLYKKIDTKNTLDNQLRLFK